MKRYAVYVATTGGSVRIEQVTREQWLREPMVGLGKKTVEELDVSKAYGAFIKQLSSRCAPLFRPDEAGAFRLDVSDRIDDAGYSWQLAVFAAHAIETDDGTALAGPEDDADAAIWLTGEVDADLGVREVAHIAEKLHRSQPDFARWRRDGLTVTLFVPAGRNHHQTLNAALPAGVVVVPVKQTQDVTADLGLAAESKSAPQDPTTSSASKEAPPKKGLRPRWRQLAMVAVALAVAALVLLARVPSIENPGDATLDSSERAAAALSVLERRAPAGKTCPAVHMGAEAAVTRPIPRSAQDQLESGRLSGLCGLSFVVDLAGGTHYVAAFSQVLSGRLLQTTDKPGDLTGATPISGRREWAVDLPLRLSDSLEYRLVAVLSDERPVADDAAWLSDQTDWPAAIEALADRGLSVISLSHKIDP